MMNVSCRPAMNRLPAISMILGMLLLAGCAGSSRSVMEPAPMDTGGGPVMDLGEWNAPMAGAREVSDTNEVLRAYYDDSGIGHVVAAAPVQPQGAGTAVWNGMWSGAIEVDPDPTAAAGLALLGTTPEQLTGLEGAARVTAYFGSSSGGVMADLTYMDLGLDDFGITELTSDRVAVTGGRFAPTKTESADTSIDFQGVPLEVTVTGEFAGEGAFGGTDAAGVVGYIGGDITVAYEQETRNLGTFQSVFYATGEGN